VLQTGCTDVLTPARPDHASPSSERRHMAISKSTRRTRPRTNPTPESILHKSNVSAERRRAWKAAQSHSEGLLRFPAYEDIYLLNVHGEGFIELLKKIGGPLSNSHQVAVQQVRSEASQHVLETMNAIEITDTFLQEQFR
jgi:hypothetical protein